MDAVAEMGRVIKMAAERTADRDAIGCAKLVVFCNAVPIILLWPELSMVLQSLKLS